MTIGGAYVITQDEERLAAYCVSTVDCRVGIVTSTTSRAVVLGHGSALP